MRILNAGQNYRISGGSDRYMLDLEVLLNSKGHQVVPFAAQHPDNIPTPWSEYFPERNNFDHPKMGDLIGYVYSNSARRQIKRLLKVEKFDLAHLHIYYGQLTGAILGSLAEEGIPIVQTLHEFKLVCPVYTMDLNGNFCRLCQNGKFNRCVINRCNRGSVARSALSTIESYVSKWLGGWEKINRFVCVSNFQRELISSMGVSADRLTTVHNFIAPHRYRKAVGSGDYVLYFGRLERIKGVFTLLNAAKKLPHIPFIIAGDGNAASDVRRTIELQKLPNVKAIGFQHGDTLDELIAGCRFSVLPTEWSETFGLTVLETFMKGRPVIASKMGGIQEIINDGVDGKFFAAGNAQNLAAEISNLWEHVDDCREMGLCGQRKAMTEFDPETHYCRLNEVYQQVLI